MVTICILVGLALFACGVIIACVTKKERNDKSNRVPPLLPPRVNTSIHSPSVIQIQAQTNDSSTTHLLPPRRSYTSVTANTTRRTVQGGYGPRGIKPTQFPCCPYDKQRNIPGAHQVIFWDSGANCYRCSRGHQFKSNGRIF